MEKSQAEPRSRGETRNSRFFFSNVVDFPNFEGFVAAGQALGSACNTCRQPVDTYLADRGNFLRFDNCDFQNVRECSMEGECSRRHILLGLCWEGSRWLRLNNPQISS